MKLLIGSLAPAILIFLNILFYVAYPIKLATSLLFAIPKKGDNKIVSNLRGIQMQPLLAILYDRKVKLAQNKRRSKKENQQLTRYFYYVPSYTWPSFVM